MTPNPLASELYDQTLIGDAQRVAMEYLRPNASQTDRDGRFPESGLQALARAGFWGLTIPKIHGGLEANLLTTVLIIETLAQECASTAMCFKMHLEGLNPLRHLATTEQAVRFLVPIAEGKLYVGVAANEPGVGVGNIQALAKAVNDGYQVEAVRKAFVTSAHFADIFSFTARNDPDSTNTTRFIVERKNVTCDVEGQWDGLGMRGNDSCSVVFTGFIPGTNVVGQPGDREKMRSFHIPFVYLTYAAVYLGIAEGAYNEVRQHVIERAPRLAQIETVQRHFGEMVLSIERTRALVHEAAAQYDRGSLPGEHIHMAACLAADETAVEVTDLAMLVGGGVSYAKGNNLERYMRDARAGPVMVPQDDLTKLALGRASLRS